MPDWLIHIDTILFIKLNAGAANALFDWLMPIVTSTRNIRYVIVPTLALLFVFGGGKGRSVVLVAILLVTISDQFVSHLLKPIIDRHRPCHDIEQARVLIRCGLTRSFPSGHAATTMASAVFFGYHYRRWLWPLVAVSILISYSRIYLGVHYPFDMLGGWVIGMAISAGMIVLYRRYFCRWLGRLKFFRESDSSTAGNSGQTIASIALLFCLTTCFVSCSTDDLNRPVVVLAAASLSQPLNAIVEQFEIDHDTRIRIAYGASGTLAQQIRGGAEADLFLIADTSWIGQIARLDGRSIRTWTILLTNRLAVVGLRSQPVEIQSLEQLTEDRFNRIAIADPTSAPVGRYAVNALRSLGLVSRLEQKILPTENAAVTTAIIRSGLADVGISYETDVANYSDLKILYVIPDSLHQPIAYGLAIIGNDAVTPTAAAEFYRYLQSGNAMAVFADYGFQPIVHDSSAAGLD